MAKSRAKKDQSKGGAKRCPKGCTCGRHKKKKQEHGNKTIDNEGNEIIIQDRTAIRQNEFIEALGKSYGIIQPALDHIKLARSTFREWYNNQPEFRQRVKDMKLVQREFVESRMIERIAAKHPSDRLIEVYMTHPAFAAEPEFQNDNIDSDAAPTVMLIPAKKKSRS